MNRTSRRIVDVIVIGRPQQKGSKQPVMFKREGGGVDVVVRDANKRAKPWQHAIAAEIAEHRAGESLIRGPVLVTLHFYFARPRGHYGTGKNANRLRDGAPSHMIVKPDLDKLERTALDALTGTALADDCQVVSMASFKDYGEPERLEIVVEEIERW